MKRLNLPLKDNNQLNDLKAGDIVLISGTLYTARDAAHKRLVELINNNQDLPIDINFGGIYYVGPTPAKPNEVIGSAGPTSSYRMDDYTLPLLEKGLKVMIGKGSRSSEYKEQLKQFKAVYLSSIGGCGVTIKNAIKDCQLVCYEDLGAEAIYKIEVEDFYTVVTYDIHGNDLLEEGIKKYAKRSINN